MLDNPFPVTSLCKLNNISVCVIQVSTKITCKHRILFSESHAFFWSDPRYFGLLGKFQHNIKISIKTARVSRLSFRFLWLCPNAALRFEFIYNKCQCLLIICFTSRKALLYGKQKEFYFDIFLKFRCRFCSDDGPDYMVYSLSVI